MKALRLFADLQLTGDQAIDFNGQRIPSKSFLREHVLQTAADFGADGEWAFLLNVEVVGRREGQPLKIVGNSNHPSNAEWGHSATARMTGIPASIGAQKLACREVARTGVMAPDGCFEPMAFFPELARRGIQVTFSSHS
jgi:saccharopine dehydrogenase-like NADP-dependent oxidoreductase